MSPCNTQQKLMAECGKMRHMLVCASSISTSPFFPAHTHTHTQSLFHPHPLPIALLHMDVASATEMATVKADAYNTLLSSSRSSPRRLAD